jgi:hypothetical protein
MVDIYIYIKGTEKRIKDKMHSVYGSIERSKGEKKERNTRFCGLKIGKSESLCTCMWMD